jgi:isopenicillin-N epimerase
MIPCDLAGMGCDFYGGNCHKWLLAPSGAGFLYVGPGSEDRVQPLQVSWGWHYDRGRADERDDFGATPRLRAFEFEGTRDPCAWLSVPRAIAFQESLGWERIRARAAQLSSYVRERLGSLQDLNLVTPAEPSLHGAMMAFGLPERINPIALRHDLWQGHHIEVPIIDWFEKFVSRTAPALESSTPRIGSVSDRSTPVPWRYLVRVSTWWYNMEDEVDRLANALRQLLTV